MCTRILHYNFGARRNMNVREYETRSIYVRWKAQK